MKKLSLALAILATLPSIAVAQPATVPASAPTVAPAAVNPFNGKSLSVESTQRELEALKMLTQGIEERLKQQSLTADIDSLPARKALDSEKAQTAVAKEQLTRQELAVKSQELKDAAKARTQAEQAARAANVRQKAPAASAAQAPAPIPAPVVNVVSVVETKSGRRAVLDIDGRALVAASGDTTPQGKLVVNDDHSVTLGGKRLSVHNATLGRVSTPSNLQPPVTAQGGQRPAILPATLPQPTGALPPLTLPPTVPAPARN